MQIKPAILPHNFNEITEKLARIEGLVNHVQIDLCDGIFGREKTWLPDGTEKLPESFSYEFDIMMNDWRESMLHALSLGVVSIVAHVDLFEDGDMETLISIVSPHKANLGIAVSNDKTLEFHADMIRRAKSLYANVFIQVMGINQVGEQGQLFDEESIGRVTTLKQQFGDMNLQVDGGMNLETAKKIKDAGADTIVVGSYIFGRDDAGASLEELNTATA
ncbi:MAG: ribulose-phosphate 3-epimerase, ribulose-phosphate 3-epimerase [Candidatus Nomurabacteria bacterium]|nr:ribulose-phosphate 3-epimerase, ribulose-phosphate 3-epimerase [Candidatus Nomurabacteria bacterium]